MADESLTKIVEFLEEIGLEVEFCEITEETFLPGILIKEGRMLVDRKKLLYVGDLLHEAGHLAVVPSRFRKLLSDKVEVPEVNMDLIEVQAIAWSYSACLHLGIAPEVVFHENGYKGNSQSLLLSFSLGVFVGVTDLEKNGMTYSFPTAQEKGVLPYPNMVKWLID